MLKKLIGIMLPVFLLIVGLAMGGGYFHFKLEKERAIFQNEINKLDRMTGLLQQKYREQKAVEGQLRRNKLLLEGRKREMEAEAADLKEQSQAVSAELENVRTKNQKLSDSLAEMRARHSEVSDKVASLEADIEQMRREQTARQEAHREEIEKLNQAKAAVEAELNASLKQTGRHLNRCESDNAKLCLLAEELLEKYENKGTAKQFLHTEPFTQIKRVELERLIQEYRHKVEDLRRRKNENEG